MVRIYVARVRKRLGEEAIATGPSGYTLSVEPEAIDLHWFARLYWEARRGLDAGDPGEAVRRSAEALALWRGGPLGEFDQLPFARDEIARLEGLRLSLIEHRLDAELALGPERHFGLAAACAG